MPKYIDRTIKASDEELLDYRQVAEYLAMDAAEFAERVAEFKAFPPGTDPANIQRSRWTWLEVFCMAGNLKWHEELYRKRKRRFDVRAKEVRRQRRQKRTRLAGQQETRLDQDKPGRGAHGT